MAKRIEDSHVLMVAPVASMAFCGRFRGMRQDSQGAALLTRSFGVVVPSCAETPPPALHCPRCGGMKGSTSRLPWSSSTVPRCMCSSMDALAPPNLHPVQRGAGEPAETAQRRPSGLLLCCRQAPAAVHQGTEGPPTRFGPRFRSREAAEAPSAPRSSTTTKPKRKTNPLLRVAWSPPHSRQHAHSLRPSLGRNRLVRCRRRRGGPPSRPWRAPATLPKSTTRKSTSRTWSLRSWWSRCRRTPPGTSTACGRYD